MVTISSPLYSLVNAKLKNPLWDGSATITLLGSWGQQGELYVRQVNIGKNKCVTVNNYSIAGNKVSIDIIKTGYSAKLVLDCESVSYCKKPEG